MPKPNIIVRSPKPLTVTKYLSLEDIDHMWEEEDIKVKYIVSQRSIGKSTAGRKLCVKDWKEHGRKFIWLRTTEEQLKKYMKTSEKGWMQMGIKMENGMFFDAETNELCGIGVGLNNCHLFSSGEFDEIYNLIYDEFIPTKTERKIPSVFAIFVNFIKTVERDRKGFKVYCLGNAWTKNNAHFLAFKYQYKEGFTVVKSPRLKLQILIFCTTEHYYYVADSKDSTASGLAEFEPELELMMNSGKFSFDDDRCIWNEKYIPIKDILYYIEIESNKFTVAQLNAGQYIFINKPKSYKPGIKVLNMTLSDMIKSGGQGTILERQDCIEYVDTWLTEFTKGNLFFNTYDTRDVIIKYVNKIKGMIINKW